MDAPRLHFAQDFQEFGHFDLCDGAATDIAEHILLSGEVRISDNLHCVEWTDWQ
jgi:hypothetical protein